MTRNPIVIRLQSWGVWPALVMVLSQFEAAFLCGYSIPWPLVLVTLAGTTLMYGADRVVERMFLSELEKRHQKSSLDIPLFLLSGTALCIGFYNLSQQWFHFAILGCLGLCYLLATTGIFFRMPLAKEVLGATTFSYLVWAWFTPQQYAFVVGFWFIGLSNFLFESERDIRRDQENSLPTLAIIAPRLQLWFRIGAAWLGFVLLCMGTSPSIPFLSLAFLHGIWQKKWPGIDLAFLCLLARPIVILLF